MTALPEVPVGPSDVSGYFQLSDVAQLGALRLLTKQLNLDQLLATVTALIQRN